MNLACSPSANFKQDHDVEPSNSALRPDVVDKNPDVVDKNKVAVLRDHRVTPVKIDAAPRARRGATGRVKRRKTFRPSAIIVDKCAVSRAGIGAMLAGDGYKVALTCADLDDLQPGQLAKSLADPNPALVLIGLDEVSEHILSGIQVLIDQGFRVVVLGQRLTSAAVYEVLRLGTYGYLLKDEIQPALLSSALALVRFGSVVIAPSLAGLGLGLPTSRIVDYKNVCAQDIPLSKGDLTILELLTQGASNKMIARKLEIAEATVKVRMMFLLRKLHVSNRTQAAIWATQHLAKAAEVAA